MESPSGPTEDPRHDHDRIDELLPLSLARHLVPKGADGKTRAPSTLWRWCHKGLDGVKLQHVKVGRTAYTKESWLSEFFARLAGAAGPETEGLDHRKDDRSSSKEVDTALAEEAERDLRELGIVTELEG